MRITSSGNFTYCRWSNDRNNVNIRDTSPVEFFQQHMQPVRGSMLAGEPVAECSDCWQMEQHHKVSGRQKQLLKTGVVLDQFEKSLRSSPYWSTFANSDTTDLMPVDWQIDLGNHCNSGCVFCVPESSSKLAQEFKKLKIVHNAPASNWSSDPELVDQLIHSLTGNTQPAYLHFIGGETLITPAFKIILQKLITAGVNINTSIGFTTNLTVWEPEIVELLKQFGQVHLGMSVECFHAVNDYVRWPSQISSVKEILAQWLAVGRQHNWYLSLRTTPTILTVAHLVELYEFASEQNVGIESCNFLYHPPFMRMSVLPMAQRTAIADQIQQWIDKQNVTAQAQTVNIRDPNQLKVTIVQDAASYVDYLLTAPDETHRLPELVQYLKLLESSRSNSVLDYVPEYEHIFRSAGY